MQIKCENDLLIIVLEGRIDSTNASENESLIMDAINAHTDLIPVFDAEKLTYISSAGLRVLMKAGKAVGKKLAVRNVSKDIYDILESTGFTNILEVSKKIRQISVDGCPVIGSGGYGTVYRIDAETIAKLYTPGISLETVRHERAVAQKAFLLGVPTAISYDVVQCGQSYGVVFELLNAKTVAQVIDAEPQRVAEMGIRSAAMLKSLHNITLDSDDFPNRKTELIEWHKKIAPFITPAESDEILNFIINIPESKNFLHGDFNSKNVMINGDDFLLIDIGDASFGHPVFDVAGLVLAYRFLPNSPRSKAERYRLLGFHLNDANAMLYAMFAQYFDIDKDDTAAIEAQIQKIMPYAHLLASYHATRMVNFDPEYTKKFTDGLMRHRLIPSIKQVPPLEW